MLIRSAFPGRHHGIGLFRYWPEMLITDDAYEAGLARLRAAAATQPGPVIDALDLLVLRARHATATAPPPASPATGQSAE